MEIRYFLNLVTLIHKTYTASVYLLHLLSINLLLVDLHVPKETLRWFGNG